MESAPLANEEYQEGSESSSEKFDTSKKKRRKTRIPLKSTVEKEVKKSKKLEKTKVDLFLPEIDPVKEPQADEKQKNSDIEPKPESEFAGELRIDHTHDIEPASESEASSVEADPAEGVNVFEALLDASEVERAKKVAESLGIMFDTENEDELPPPPKVAPPLPFASSVAPLAAETTNNIPLEVVGQSIAEEAIGIHEPTEPSIPVETSPLRGRLAEEWAAVRSRATESDELSVSESEAQEREASAVQAGVRRGVLTGGLVGYMLGRRGRRAVEREAKAAARNHENVTRKLSEKVETIRSESEKRQSVIRRTEEQMRELMNRSWDKQILKKPAETAPEAPIVLAAKKIERSLKSAPESVKGVRVEKVKPAPETQKITEETYKAPEGTRIETSAWHRIEVDERTGKVAENPKVEYGEAFKSEQSSERLAKQAAKAQTAAQVGMTLLYGGTQPSDTPLVPPSLQKQSNQTTKQDSSKLPPLFEDTSYVVRKISNNITSPLTWVFAIVLLLALIASGAI